MKRIPSVVIICLTLVSGIYAQDTSVNINTLTAPKLTSVPTIDGDLSDSAWAKIDWIPVTGDGDSPAATDPGDLDIKMKVGWDDTSNALYFAVNVIDESFVDIWGFGSSLNEGGYNNERLEIILDGSNSGSADSSTTSGYHQQYCFDFPNNFDGNDPANNNVGYFDSAKIPVSTTFIKTPVYEHIEGTLQVNRTCVDFDQTDLFKQLNVADDYCQSAAQIRVTDPAAKEWFLAPVEFNWEVKIVVFNFLMNNTQATAMGTEPLYDSEWMIDPVNIKNGWIGVFKDPANELKKLKLNDVIGFCLQQNDGDVCDDGATVAREHQTNTTGLSGDWNSSEHLTGLILGPPPASVADWYLR